MAPGMIAVGLVGVAATVAIGWRVVADHGTDEANDNLLRGLAPRTSRPRRAVGDRVARRIGARATVFFGPHERDAIARRLDLAGMADRGWYSERFFLVQFVVVTVGLVLAGVAAIGIGGGAGVASAALIVAVAAIGPGRLLDRRIERRQATIRRAMPDAIDQLSVCAEAGLGFDAALERVAASGTGPLAVELRRVVQDMRLGLARTEALAHLDTRTDMDEVRDFIGAVDQATVQGLPLSAMLRIQATELRSQRRASAEARAGGVTVKIVFPLMLCILPALFVVVLGPILFDLRDSFG